MGGAHSLPEAEVEELLEQTKFKKKEIQQWYSDFIKDCPGGLLNKEQFNDLYSKLYISPECNQPKTDHIFRSLDTNHDNVVSFRELLSALSLSKRGSVREKMEWLFEIYDVDGNGRITLEELCDVVQSMKHHSGKDDKKFSTPVMTAVFTSVDSDSDGYLTMDEFVEGVEGNPELVAVLNCGQVLPLI